jgi:hypothetical protein
VIPIERAEPAIVRSAASMSEAVKSGSLAFTELHDIQTALT